MGGATLELTIAQFWSSRGAASLSLALVFHGLTLGGGGAAGGGGVTLDGAAGVQRITASSPLRRTKVKPEAKLTHVLHALRPCAAEWRLEPRAGPRDAWPDARVVYRSLLTYKFVAPEKGQYTPTLPLLNKLLYECARCSPRLSAFLCRPPARSLPPRTSFTHLPP